MVWIQYQHSANLVKITSKLNLYKLGGWGGEQGEGGLLFINLGIFTARQRFNSIRSFNIKIRVFLRFRLTHQTVPPRLYLMHHLINQEPWTPPFFPLGALDPPPSPFSLESLNNTSSVPQKVNILQCFHKLPVFGLIVHPLSIKGMTGIGNCKA